MCLTISIVDKIYKQFELCVGLLTKPRPYLDGHTLFGSICNTRFAPSDNVALPYNQFTNVVVTIDSINTTVQFHINGILRQSFSNQAIDFNCVNTIKNADFTIRSETRKYFTQFDGLMYDLIICYNDEYVLNSWKLSQFNENISNTSMSYFIHDNEYLDNYLINDKHSFKKNDYFYIQDSLTHITLVDNNKMLTNKEAINGFSINLWFATKKQILLSNIFAKCLNFDQFTLIVYKQYFTMYLNGIKLDGETNMKIRNGVPCPVKTDLFSAYYCRFGSANAKRSTLISLEKKNRILIGFGEFKGIVSDISIWDRPLSPDDINQLYTNSNIDKLNYKGLLSYFPLTKNHAINKENVWIASDIIQNNDSKISLNITIGKENKTLQKISQWTRLLPSLIPCNCTYTNGTILNANADNNYFVYIDIMQLQSKCQQQLMTNNAGIIKIELLNQFENATNQL